MARISIPARFERRRSQDGREWPIVASLGDAADRPGISGTITPALAGAAYAGGSDRTVRSAAAAGHCRSRCRLASVSGCGCGYASAHRCRAQRRADDRTRCRSRGRMFKLVARSWLCCPWSAIWPSPFGSRLSVAERSRYSEKYNAGGEIWHVLAAVGEKLPGGTCFGHGTEMPKRGRGN